MCVDHDAQLPALPPGSYPATSEALILEAEDGARFRAFAADTPQRSGASIIVLPDIRGLFSFYEQLATRFAEEGHPAVAIDYFGRTAGTDERDTEFPFMDHIAQTTSEGFNADVAAAAAYLRQQDPSTRVYAVGFCFGGNMAWGAATQPRHGLAGAVGFYGKPDADRPLGDGPIWDRAHLMTCKVLSLFGGADAAIPPETVAQFAEAMDAAGVDHEVHTYEGAPHSFFDRGQADFADAALDAWNRIQAFVAE